VLSFANLRDNGPMSELPERVQVAQGNAEQAGFPYSCEEEVGPLLAVLAAAVPTDGRILELGTGAGVGTAWLVHGLGERTDVGLVSVESDASTMALARSQDWPGYVRFVVDDAVRALPSLGRFHLLFADAQGGKWDRLDLSIAALEPGGTLVVDDMAPRDWWNAEHAANQEKVRATLARHPQLTTCELAWSSGVLLSVRQH
jgi:predicted O-methyltransferase YrrM